MLAQITYVVVLKVVVGVPANSPVVLFRLSPVGIERLDSHEAIVPPEVMGVRETTETLTISSSVVEL